MADAGALRGMHNDDLRKLGRVPYPLLMRRGDKGFTRVSWRRPWATRSWLKSSPPQRTGYFVTSRGITNETYYTIQKLARLRGHEQHRQLLAPLPRPQHTGIKPTSARGVHCSLERLARHGPARPHWQGPAQQPARDDEVYDLAKQHGTKGRRDQSRPRARARPLPGPASSKARLGTKSWTTSSRPIGGDIAFIKGLSRSSSRYGGMRPRLL